MNKIEQMRYNPQMDWFIQRANSQFLEIMYQAFQQFVSDTRSNPELVAAQMFGKKDKSIVRKYMQHASQNMKKNERREEETINEEVSTKDVSSFDE